MQGLTLGPGHLPWLLSREVVVDRCQLRAVRFPTHQVLAATMAAEVSSRPGVNLPNEVHWELRDHPELRVVDGAVSPHSGRFHSQQVCNSRGGGKDHEDAYAEIGKEGIRPAIGCRQWHYSRGRTRWPPDWLPKLNAGLESR